MSDEIAALDCGDNSCVFAVNRRGMRTNGGCRCLRNLLPDVRSSELRTLELRLRKTIAAHELAAAMAVLCEGCREGIPVRLGFPGDPVRGYAAEWWHGDKGNSLADQLCRAGRLRNAQGT